MMRQFLIAIFILGLAGSAGSSAHAAEESPDTEAAADFIRTLADETLTVLQKSDVPAPERRQQFEDLLEKGVNTDYISRFVLGRYWRQASEEQQREFQKLFKQYLLANLTGRLSGEYDNESFSVENAVASGSRDVLVRSEITRASGPPLPVEWRVRKFEQGWQIIDLKAEGVSLAITQREEYGTVAQRRGIDGLLSALRDQVKAIKKGKADGSLADQS